jgi:steroid delta-isomerase-like uncharacterized protein
MPLSNSPTNPHHQKNITLVRTLLEEVMNKGNLRKLDELCAPQLKFHDVALTSEFQGLKGLKDAEAIYMKAFPGKKLNIEEILAADDKVIVRWRVRATHKGAFNGCDPSNRPIDISGISIYKISNDKITEITQHWDRLGLFEQIGEIQASYALHH